MARPTKIGDDARTGLVKLRVTPAEKQRLGELAKAAGVTASDFARGRIFGAAPVQLKVTPRREALIRLLAELGKQGSNLNQIAKLMNAHKGLANPGGLPPVLVRALEEHAGLCQLIRKELQHGH